LEINLIEKEKEKDFNYNNSNSNLVDFKDKIDNSFFDLIKYPSIRTKFISLCFLWFSCTGCYYGLDINIKNLNGDLYFHYILNYSFDAFIYFIAGFLSNIKFMGRKYTMVLFYLISTVGFILHCFISLSSNVGNMVLLISRMCVSGNYVILYIYTIELYPSPVRAIGFGINNGLAKIAPIIIPFALVEFPKVIFFVYLLMNLICLVLVLFFLPETLGKPLKEIIDECIEDKENLGKNFKGSENS
jgi:OCT family organic cation transporter-like MFS transporter 4/5